MMSSERAPEELDEVNPRTRPRRPNTTLDSDGVRNERIRSLKNTRRGHIANVTAKVNEVIKLLSDEGNVQEVKEKLTTSKEAFRKFGEAHRSYAAELVNKEEKTKCMEYFSREEKSTEIIDRHGLIDMVMCLFQRILRLCTRRRVPIFFMRLVRNPPRCCFFSFSPFVPF